MVEKFSVSSATHWNGELKVRMNNQKVFPKRCHARREEEVKASSSALERAARPRIFTLPREAELRRCTVMQQKLRSVENEVA